VGKLKQFNDEFKAAQAAWTLNEEEWLHLEAAKGKIAMPNFYHVTTFMAKELAAFDKMVLQWPVEKLFPVLDLARLAALHPHMMKHLVGQGHLATLIRRGLSTPECSSSLAANVMLSLRLWANAFLLSEHRAHLIELGPTLLPEAARATAAANKNARLALGTVLLNYSTILLAPSNKAKAPLFVEALLPLLVRETDEEAQFIFLATLGALIYANDEAKEAARRGEAGKLVAPLAQAKTEKLRDCAKDISNLLN